MAEEKRETIKIHVEFGENRLDFEGSPEEAVRALLAFLQNAYPAYEMARRLTLTVDLEELLKSLEGVLAFTPEGPVILAGRERLERGLSIRELILLHLVKAYVGFRLGKLPRESLSVDELLKATGGKVGAVAGRLSEMVSEELIERLGRAEYKITTYGVKHFLESILPKVRSLLEEG
ncbi:MAG: hypothetical protein DRO52_06195 [Candidatus Hecatellales archaeon]|nr:MAG: hypothetical protein DRO52_06195 [Candidatus Hecatellales archaeon]